MDLVALRALGDRLRQHTWEQVVERTVERSGGTVPAGLQHDSASLDEAASAEVQDWLEELVLRRKRAENAKRISAGR